MDSNSQAGNVYLLGMGKLADIYHSYQLFPLRPKMHKTQCGILQRLANGSRINPKLFSCFADESFVGRISKASRMSHPSQVAKTTLARYVLWLASYMYDK